MYGVWYPLALKAEESASTCVGQNSTQKPQALQRSATICTDPLAIAALSMNAGPSRGDLHELDRLAVPPGITLRSGGSPRTERWFDSCPPMAQVEVTGIT